ncbi:MAG: GNAT family N-acetyltransferase [Rhodoferax sp.]
MKHHVNIPGFTVRRAALEDAEAWAAYVCLPEVKLHTSSTAETVEDVRNEIRKTLMDGPAAPIRFVLETETTRQLVATVGFHTISPLNGTAEIAYDVTPSFWGKGFEALGWHRVQGTTVVPNLASQRVLERCDFKREGLLRNFRIVRGQPMDYWLYSAVPGEVEGAA